MLDRLLEGYDEAKRANMVDGFTNGFSIGCVLPRAGDSGRNLPSCDMKPEQVERYIEKEMGMGRLIGPYDAVPFEMWKISPVGLVPKAATGEYRVIHHLSYPAGGSVNDGIPRERVAVQYGSIDDAIGAIMSRKSVAFMSKCDIECAYRVIPIRPEERGLLGFRWKGKLYFDCALPMGCSSSAAIFQEFSNALVWIAKNKFGCKDIVNVLDDFLFIEDTEELGKIALGSFERICDLVGVPLKASKTVRPCVAITFLGLVLDADRRMLVLPEEKVGHISEAIEVALGRKSIALKDLQSIIGKLNFACLAVPLGRPFLRRLIDLTRGTFVAWHRITITAQARKDLEAWRQFLFFFNGRSMFCQRYWVAASVVIVETDASGKWGFGAIFQSSWLWGCWPTRLLGQSIAVKEMVPVVIALQTWAARLQGRCVKIMSDNMSVVCAINAQSCRDPKLMGWVRRFFVLCALNNIKVTAEHVTSRGNQRADALSRGSLQLFRALKPEADKYPNHWDWLDCENLM